MRDIYVLSQGTNIRLKHDTRILSLKASVWIAYDINVLSPFNNVYLNHGTCVLSSKFMDCVWH
jgi:hypothetical protein